MKKSRTKRLTASLLALALVFSMAIGMVPAKAAADGTFKVESALVDGTVELTVKAVNLKKIASVQLNVTYEADTLEYTGYDQGTNVDGEYAFVSAGEKDGVVTIAYIDNNAPDASADGLTLAKLKFSVKEDITVTTTPVTLELKELYAEATDDTTQNRADAANTEVRETYGDPVDVTAFVPAEAVQVPTKEVSSRILGDVNGDGKVSTEDATYILQYAIGIRKLQEEELKVGDVNNDGKVSTEDATYILQHVVGKRPSLGQ